MLVETWQANAAGRYNHPADTQDKSLDRGFRGWARTGTDFDTVAHGYVSVTPLQVDLTRHAVLPALASWLDGLNG